MQRMSVKPALVAAAVALAVVAGMVITFEPGSARSQPLVGPAIQVDASGDTPVASDDIIAIPDGSGVVTADPGTGLSDPGGCDPVPGGDPVPTAAPPVPVPDGPDIQGTIVTLDAVKGYGVSPSPRLALLVRSDAPSGGTCDQAYVTVLDTTRVFVDDADGRREVGFASLSAGQQVTVTFSGPVMESYPVQATALEIVIL